MSGCKSKIHQIRFPLRLCPRPRSRSLQRSPRPLAVFERSTSKRRERGTGERERKGKVNGRAGRGDELGRGRDLVNQKLAWWLGSYARPQVGRKRATSGQRGERKGGEVRGTAREKMGRNEKKWRGWKLEQGRGLAKAGPVSVTSPTVANIIQFWWNFTP